MRMLIPLGAVVLLTAEDCTTKAPTSDSSPPSLEWVITNKTAGPAHDSATHINGSGTVNVKRGEEYQVTLNARDPEGVRKIQLGGAGGYGCSNGNVGQSVTIDQKTDVQELSPNAQNEVLKQIFLLRSAFFASGWDCQSGWTFSGGNLQFFGTGENYFNGQAKGTLTFAVSP
ncbi:MAG TPA: hypothetical protein VE871_04690 [Longimicrobium sp.]|nr:hypothetical protein [Longimicrobium sp.]